MLYMLDIMPWLLMLDHAADAARCTIITQFVQVGPGIEGTKGIHSEIT